MRYLIWLWVACAAMAQATDFQAEVRRLEAAAEAATDPVEKLESYLTLAETVVDEDPAAAERYLRLAAILWRRSEEDWRLRQRVHQVLVRLAETDLFLALDLAGAANDRRGRAWAQLSAGGMLAHLALAQPERAYALAQDGLRSGRLTQRDLETVLSSLWYHHPALALDYAELMTDPASSELAVRLLVAALPFAPDRVVALAERWRAAGPAQEQAVLWALWHTGQSSWHRYQAPELIVDAVPGEGVAHDVIVAALERYLPAEEAVPTLEALPTVEARALGLAAHLGDLDLSPELRGRIIEQITPAVGQLPLDFQKLYVDHQLAMANEEADRSAAAAEHSRSLTERLLDLGADGYSRLPKRGPAVLDVGYAELMSIAVGRLIWASRDQALRLYPRWRDQVDDPQPAIELAIRIAGEDFAQAMRIVDYGEPESREERRVRFAGGLAPWSRELAQRALATIDDPGRRAVAQAAMVDSLCRVDPGLAEQWAAEIEPPVLRSAALQSVFDRHLTGEDWPAAERVAKAMPHSWSRSEVLAQLALARLEGGEAGEAERLAATITDAGPKSEVLSRLAEHWGEQGQTERALAAMLAVPDYNLRVTLLGREVAARADDPAAALALIERESSAEARQELLIALARPLAGKDPDAAYRFARTIDYPPLRDAVLQEVAVALAETDLPRAREVLSEIRTDYAWREAAQVIVARSAAADLPAPELLPLLRRLSWLVWFDWRYLDDPVKADLIAETAGWMARRDRGEWETSWREMMPPESGAAWSSDSHLNASFVVPVVVALAGEQPALALEVASWLPTQERARAAGALVEAYAVERPGFAADAVRTLVLAPAPRASLFLDIAAAAPAELRAELMAEARRLTIALESDRDRLYLLRRLDAMQ